MYGVEEVTKSRLPYPVRRTWTTQKIKVNPRRISSRPKQSSKARGIYAHYKQKYQRFRQRMQNLNIRQLDFEVAHTSRSRYIPRYAVSAPEQPVESEFFDDEDYLSDENFEADSPKEEKEENFSPIFVHPNKNLIQELIEVDRLEQLLNLRGLQIRGGRPDQEKTAAASLRLSKIGDEIVEQLVEWTKVLPFYNELPVEVHTHLLTQRWSELVLISACFYAVCTRCDRADEIDMDQPSFNDSHTNLVIFQRRLSSILNKHIPIENVVKEAGQLIEKFTALLNVFSKLKITLEAYVCLKAIALVHYGNPTSDDEKMVNLHSVYAPKVQLIQDQFVKALQIHLSQIENGPRLSDLLGFLPLLNSTASILLNSKMFYVPFLICREPDRFYNNQNIASSDENGNQLQYPENTDAQSEANCTSSSISDIDSSADLP
ncbi:hypothetical protein FO519_001248 [Halicephalobus sp. NKZ332]|nr:hypothetical protein FO519_001248 [Halicephalobus sp. NKZ332]